jgi:hypothetical protein
MVRSFSGKITLVAELVRSGATNYSDEFAVVRPLRENGPHIQIRRLRDRLPSVTFVSQRAINSFSRVDRAGIVARCLKAAMELDGNL